MRSLVWLLRSWWSFCGHPRLFPWCSFPQSAVHLLVGFSFCTLVLDGVARVLDLWRAAEDSPAPFSLASSLCATPEQQRLPCPALLSWKPTEILTWSQQESRVLLWYWIWGHSEPTVSLSPPIRRPSRKQRGSLGCPWFDHRVLLMGKSKGAH